MLFESGLGLVKKHKQIKSKGMEKDILSNIKQKKVGVATLISDKTDFRVRKIIWNKDGHYMIKGSILKEDITVLNVYVPNNRAPKHKK